MKKLRKLMQSWQILGDWLDDLIGIGHSLPRGASKKAIRESDWQAAISQLKGATDRWFAERQKVRRG